MTYSTQKRTFSLTFKIAAALLIQCISIGTIQNSLAQSKKNIKWNMVVTESRNDHFQEILNQSLVQYVREFSNGRLTIDISPQKSAKEPDVLKSLQSQEFQIAHLSPASLYDSNPSLALFSSTPFGMISAERNAWLYEAGGLGLMQKAYAKYNVYAFPGGNSGIQMGGWFSKQIKSRKDIKGISIASEGISKTVFSELGAKTVNLPAEKLVQALQNNTVEAITGGSPATESNAEFAKIAEYYYTGWNEPSKERQFFVEKKAYEALSKDLQLALTSAMRLAAYDIYTYMTHLNTQKLNELKQQYPELKIHAFPRDVMRALRRKSAQEVLSIQKTDTEANTIIRSIQAYQKQIRLWTQIGDQAYLNNSR